ncbi:MAG: fibronectin type III domain-containing protein [Acidobacteria bacterium]|nr:fibronectin type III domain-containing protein [Acidobacteriota bacterium]
MTRLQVNTTSPQSEQPLPRPTAPIGFEVAGYTETSATVKWNPAVDRYDLQIRKIDEEFGTEILSTISNEFTFDNLVADEPYVFRARAVSSTYGISEWSLEIDLKIEDIPEDSTPSKKRFDESASFSWPWNNTSGIALIQAGQGGAGGAGGDAGGSSTTERGEYGSSGARGADGGRSTVTHDGTETRASGGRGGAGGSGGTPSARYEQGALFPPSSGPGPGSGDAGRMGEKTFVILTGLAKDDQIEIVVGGGGRGGSGGAGGAAASGRTGTGQTPFAGGSGTRGEDGEGGYVEIYPI